MITDKKTLVLFYSQRGAMRQLAHLVTRGVEQAHSACGQLQFAAVCESAEDIRLAQTESKLSS